MSSLLDTLKVTASSEASKYIAAIKPKIVLTAPNGQKLYIDATPAPGNDSAPDATLWPKGFSVGLKSGDTPVADNITESPTKFFVQQSPVILSAPGPVGISWGIWIVLLIGLILLPLAGIYLFKK